MTTTPTPTQTMGMMAAQDLRNHDGVDDHREEEEAELDSSFVRSFIVHADGHHTQQPRQKQNTGRQRNHRRRRRHRP